MATPAQFKKNIEKIINQTHKIKFKGDDFDLCVSLLTSKKEQEIYKWIKDVLAGKINHLCYFNCFGF